MKTNNTVYKTKKGSNMTNKSYKSGRNSKKYDSGVKFSIYVEGTIEPICNKPFDSTDNESLLRYKMKKGIMTKEDYDKITIHNPF